MAKKMIILEFQIPEWKAKIVRKKAIEIYGNRKSSLNKAINDALDYWLEKCSEKAHKENVAP